MRCFINHINIGCLVNVDYDYVEARYPDEDNKTKPAVLLKLANNPENWFIMEPSEFNRMTFIANSLSELKLTHKTYLELKDLTTLESNIKEVHWRAVKIENEPKIAIKYVDFQTEFVLLPILEAIKIPIKYPIYERIYLLDGSLLDEFLIDEIYINDIHVDDIHIGDIDIDFTITKNDIFFISEKEFKSRRLEKVESIIKLKTPNELEKFRNFEPILDTSQGSNEKGALLLKKFGFEQLYHITHKMNLLNILTFGLLSHSRAHQKKLNKLDISLFQVNERRNRIEPYYNRNLHEYVPLYFNPRNPMMFLRRILGDDLIVLVIDSKILLQKNVLFTDGNAASLRTNIYSQLEYLERLNWNCINSQYWNDFFDGKRIKCAEVLIYDLIETSQIKKIIFNSDRAKRDFRESYPDFTEIAKEVNNDLFFG